MTPTQWRAAHPGLFFLDHSQPSEIARWLAGTGLLQPDETVLDAAKAGDGNMNCTLRVTTSRRSLIVKQSRPWVEKYPQFEAPWDRSLRERDFLELTAAYPALAARLPRLLHVDAEARTLVLEDLGTAGVYADVYTGRSFTVEEVTALAQWLGQLHRDLRDAPDRRGLANRDMRVLNGGHLFHIPLQPGNGLDLDAITPGLAAAARSLANDAAFVAAVHRLGETYLADGRHLLHGDFYPGSLLRTPDGPCVIDTEFAFFGRPEFDPGVFVAHLLLAHQRAEVITAFLEAYGQPDGHDESLMLGFAGVEVMRRLIGYAQLPLPCDLAAKCRLLALAHELVLSPARQVITG